MIKVQNLNPYTFLSCFLHRHVKRFTSKHIALKVDVLLAIGPENILFAGMCVLLSAQKFYIHLDPRRSEIQCNTHYITSQHVSCLLLSITALVLVLCVYYVCLCMCVGCVCVFACACACDSENSSKLGDPWGRGLREQDD